jgi:2,3-bisphosphoglycerate-dependent phosphoglycerate mutase
MTDIGQKRSFEYERQAMAVGIRVGSVTSEIGTPSFLNAFFSTISVRCEPDGWGSQFPLLMNDLYQGRLSHKNARAALAELTAVKQLLEGFPPSAVVWDIDDLSARPPWGGEIAEEITSLGNYFVSSTGRDLFELLEESLSAAADMQRDATIESFHLTSAITWTPPNDS